jgi:hypothetical protein
MPLANPESSRREKSLRRSRAKRESSSSFSLVLISGKFRWHGLGSKRNDFGHRYASSRCYSWLPAREELGSSQLRNHSVLPDKRFAEAAPVGIGSVIGLSVRKIQFLCDGCIFVNPARNCLQVCMWVSCFSSLHLVPPSAPSWFPTAARCQVRPMRGVCDTKRRESGS